MKTSRSFHRSLFLAGAVMLGLCVAVQSVSADYYDEVYSFAEVAGTTGSTFNYGAAVDGDTVYFSLNSSPNITKVDASGTSILLSTTDWTIASNGATGLTTWYAFESMGDYLVFGESSADQVWKVEKASGAISAVATTADIEAVTGMDSTSMSAYKGSCGDDYYFYEGNSDSILKVNVPTGTVSMVVTKAQLDSFANSLKVTGGFTFDAAGDLYFGESEADGIFKWDGAIGTPVLTKADITAVTGKTAAGFGDMLYGENGLMYFYESSSDSILSYDPADPTATLEIVLTEQQLLDGPAHKDILSGLAWYDGKLAFTGMGAYGFYAVPEPTVLGLMFGLAGLALLRRRSK